MATEATHGRRAEVAEATRATEEIMRPQTVPVNMYETDGAVVVVAPLPAVQPDDVHIDLWPGKLRITAHLRSAGPRDEPRANSARSQVIRDRSGSEPDFGPRVIDA